MTAELLDGELCCGDSDFGEQSRSGRLVGRYHDGVAAVDARAVAPCCPGQVYSRCSARAQRRVAI
jgi:hypothetical protein